MEKRQGALYFDREEERYNIRFGLEECYHGLYCGEGLEVLPCLAAGVMSFL